LGSLKEQKIQTNIKQLIAQGEHQTLDFKFEVSDFRKIARTLVAFSNTDGGRLLVGVKDNGALAGVRSDEEYFMVDGAARIYCKPEIKLKVNEWQVDGKKIVEVIIEKGRLKPYLAQDTEGNWIAYIRQGDQNFKADKVLLSVWEKQKAGLGTVIHFRQAEKFLLTYLEENGAITISKFRRLAGLSSSHAEKIMIDFIMLGLIHMDHSAPGVLYSLSPNYQAIIKPMLYAGY
jgi:predicted HTH transcriptional regulator